MGNCQSIPLEGILSNKTPYLIQVIITSKLLQTTKVTTTTNWGVGAFVNSFTPNVNAALSGNTTQESNLSEEVRKFIVFPGHS